LGGTGTGNAQRLLLTLLLLSCCVSPRWRKRPPRELSPTQSNQGPSGRPSGWWRWMAIQSAALIADTYPWRVSAWGARHWAPRISGV